MKIALMQLEKGDYETARLINEVMFDLNKFMTQRAAEHWVMQQRVRSSLDPLFDVQDEE